MQNSELKINYFQILEKIGKTFSKNFSIEGSDLEIYRLFALYFNDNENFEKISSNFHLNKGLYVYGRIGVGKTIIFKTFKKVFEKYNLPYNFKLCASTDVIQDYRIYGEKTLLQHMENPSQLDNSGLGIKYKGTPRVICYDDLGTEECPCKLYGSEKNVMADIILKRYDLFIDKGLKTHFTSNLDPDLIEEIYGSRVRSRLREMCNIIYIDGDDRRQ